MIMLQHLPLSQSVRVWDLFLLEGSAAVRAPPTSLLLVTVCNSRGPWAHSLLLQRAWLPRAHSLLLQRAWLPGAHSLLLQRAWLPRAHSLLVRFFQKNSWATAPPSNYLSPNRPSLNQPHLLLFRNPPCLRLCNAPAMPARVVLCLMSRDRVFT